MSWFGLLSADFFFRLRIIPHLSLSLFFTAYRGTGEWNQKSFERKKCWGGLTASLFFSGQRPEAGTLSFPLTLINLPSKNKGALMGTFRLRLRKRTAEKTDERQSEKERIPISSNTLKVINLWGRYEHTTRQPGHTMMRWRVKVRVRDRRKKPTARRGLDTDSPASFLQRP